MRWAKDGWLSKCQEYDKWSHAGGSCFATLAIYLILKTFSPFIWIVDAVTAGSLIFAAGLFLEVQQGWYADGFSWRDLTANAIGILLAVMAVIL